LIDQYSNTKGQNHEVILYLPQFNGYLYSATMSPKEHPKHEAKKTEFRGQFT